ncbi:Extra-cytoplasmic solute receptor family protein 130 [Cupriavidus taiwanensis]|uniref:Extra-cytoplasmic solute receptor family protein 130 n=1 Tax=Cupriavidus taiwanensis TaxID=164546 RepID=A0A976G413_9BURK|nr:tripartite tricarboxylate transporter substrate binding protein [Cupriavidus taiwanensis]SOZ64395.1 Extra-cytoplasmic solute receptor family protein 130 [Cupriavidus taiwanensis]SOZ65102.1 Extra-cytoplasmic solute receptor family protein 130 [Cupriavidus taiwanensis]SOZ68786.1 Extra-cytoplasmic solute receptor family protein 130 [Cupriavidus taiwanensis]SPA08208.1 Extra-cytoplasmic solute receptor family protein 130 [Cupriavidus taiwanensis]
MNPLASFLVRGLAAAICVLGMLPLHAAAYPDRAVRIIVPAPPGGVTDAALRALAERLGAAWGTPVVIENKPGANSKVAIAAARHAEPDGYTLVALTNSTMLDEVLDAAKGMAPASQALVPVTTVLQTPIVLVGSKEAGIATLADYVAIAKRKPGAVSVSSTGANTNTQYFADRLNREAGIAATVVPYGGEAPILTALLGGHLSGAFLSAAGARRAAATGKLSLLAVTTPVRSPLLPTVPSFAELGFSGLDMDSWVGLYVPPGTPGALIDKVSAEVRKQLATAELAGRFAGIGISPLIATGAEMKQRIAADKTYWERALETPAAGQKAGLR